MEDVVKKYLGIITLMIIVCLSGCSAHTNHNVKVSDNRPSEKKILTYFIMRVNIDTERVLPIDG